MSLASPLLGAEVARLVFARRPRGYPITVEGDDSFSQKWLQGDTGQGRVTVWQGDLIPSQSYAHFVREHLLQTPSIRPRIRAALQMEKPSAVFWSLLENDRLVLLNFSDRPANVRLSSSKQISMAPYAIVME